MPRRARLSLPGIPWHIIQRGNNRTACFYAEEDYRRYLDTLREMVEKYECAVHAYVLMTNHVHLLLTPSREDSAGLLMKHLGQRYVPYVNRTYRRSGTLMKGAMPSATGNGCDGRLQRLGAPAGLRAGARWPLWITAGAFSLYPRSRPSARSIASSR